MIHYIVGRNLGHLNRCVANISKFKLLSEDVINIHAFEQTHSWLRSNLSNVNIHTLTKHSFKQNTEMFLAGKLVIHDWREEVKLLKERRGTNSPIFAGIYHSDINHSVNDTAATMKFKHQIIDISQKTTDIFFHINLFQPKRIPKTSTRYVPIPLIGRDITTEPALVKDILGIPRNEPFILVQMGGGIGKYRYKYIDEWYEKINSMKIPCRIVIANQLRGENFQFQSQIIQAPLFENGIDLVNAADMVISKPGMGILTDCICTGTPLLALPADTKEREVKNLMLRHLVGNELVLAADNCSALDLAKQIIQILNKTDFIQSQFAMVPKTGAYVVAAAIKLLAGRSRKELPEIYEKILTLTPFNVK